MSESGFSLDFGWPDDGGVGELLIEQTIRGEKYATCGFKRAFTAEEIAQEYAAVGRVIPVRDVTGATRCHVRVTEVFETPFGDPDPRLVAGECDGEDIEKFQRDHRVVWELDFGDAELRHDEPLLVMLFELANDA